MNGRTIPVARDLCLFALPLLLGNILQSCYGMADMAIVGRFVGREALAAVSNTAMIGFLGNSICIGFTLGGNVLIAQLRGAGKTAALGDAIRTLLVLSAWGGILLTLVGYLSYKPILRAMNIPAEAFPDAVAYLGIACAGSVFVFGYNAVGAVFRGLGDSRRPLYFVMVAAALNLALDSLFVGVFRWGVRGAAAATVFSQAASCLAALCALKKRGDRDRGFVLHFDRHSLRADAAICGRLLRQGLPTALRAMVLNLSYLLVTALFNGYGTAAVAAAGIGLKVNTFAAMPCWAVGQAVVTMAGHSVGAKDFAKAAEIVRKGILISLLSTGVLLAAIHLCIRPFLALFSADSEVIGLGVLYLRICCSVNFIPYVGMYILDSFATGAGAPVLALVNSLLHSLLFRAGFSFLLAVWLDWGYTGLCVAESVSPLIPCCIGLLFFLRGRWRSGKDAVA